MSEYSRPKSCSTCEHRKAAVLADRCMASGFYVETERKYPSVCGKDFSAWTPRRGIFQRIKEWVSA